MEPDGHSLHCLMGKGAASNQLPPLNSTPTPSQHSPLSVLSQT
jgi:hypothetical protein